MKQKKTWFEIKAREEKLLVKKGERAPSSEAKMESLTKNWSPKIPERYFSRKMRQIQMGRI